MGKIGPVRIRFIFMLVTGVLAFLVYSRAFDNGFRHDDLVFLRHVENTSVLDSFSPSSDFVFYRPGSLLLFRAEHMLFRGDSGSYIVFNFILHLAASALVLLVMRRLGLFPGAEFMAAGLFLLGFGHYGKVVMWACCSGQIASVLLSLAGILVSLRWAVRVEDADGKDGRNRGRYLLFAAILLMTSAIFFHESAIVTPVIAAIAVMASRRPARSTVGMRGVLLMLPVPLFLTLFLFLSGSNPVYGPDKERLFQVPIYLLRYAGFALFTIQRTGIVSISPMLHRLIELAPMLQLVTGVLFMAVLGYIAFTREKGPRILSIWVPLAILPFTCIALPEGWLQLRYLYFASIPLCGLAAAGYYRLNSGRGTLVRIFSSAVVILIILGTSVLVLLLERHYAGF